MSHYAVIDLEFCRVPKTEKRKLFPRSSEIIQIGAVLLNDDLETVDEFMTHVHPEFGMVDPFIEKLTGITRADVASAPSVKEAFESFLTWLPEDAVIVSWSESDKAQITAELELKGIELPALAPYLEDWIDCQITFSELMDNDRSYKLSEALNIAAIDWSDGEHDALVDAKNTALLFIKMETDPDFEVSPYLYTSREEDTGFNNPFANLKL